MIKTSLMFIAAALLICSFYLIGGWAQHQLDHLSMSADREMKK